MTIKKVFDRYTMTDVVNRNEVSWSEDPQPLQFIFYHSDVMPSLITVRDVQRVDVTEHRSSLSQGIS